MSKRKYTSLDVKEVKTKYPKSYNKLKEWFFLPDKQAEDQPVFVPTEKGSEDLAMATLQFNSRVLYDFFDDQGIYVSLFRNEDEMFNYYVKDVSFASVTRNEAEEKVFILAFEELEKQL